LTNWLLVYRSYLFGYLGLGKGFLSLEGTRCIDLPFLLLYCCCCS